MRYAVIFEKSDSSIGAYVPDLPGCVAVGGSGGSENAHLRSHEAASGTAQGGRPSAARTRIGRCLH